MSITRELIAERDACAWNESTIYTKPDARMVGTAAISRWLESRCVETSINRLSSIQTISLPIQPPHDRAQNNLQNPVTRQLPALALKRYRINHIPDLSMARKLLQLVIELVQMLLSLLVVADLEGLHAHLPCRRMKLVEPLRARNERSSHVIGRYAVRDADDVDWLRCLRFCFVGL